MNSTWKNVEDVDMMCLLRASCNGCDLQTVRLSATHACADRLPFPVTRHVVYTCRWDETACPVSGGFDLRIHITRVP